MGNDGGSIPTRRELVKEAARNPSATELKESRNEQQEYNWTTDPISHKALAQPVVSDSTGKLYNKDTILEYLLEGKWKSDAEKVTGGNIKSLKDVVNVIFESDETASTKINGMVKKHAWKCPVTGDALGPGSKAAYIVPCGHAFSGSALKEVSGEKCLTCNTEYAANDIIPILPIAESDIARLSLRMRTLQEKGLSHSLKKASGNGKKRKKNGAVVSTDVAKEKTNDSTPEEKTAGINNSSTATITSKVMHEQEASKRRKMENETVRSLFSSRDQSKPIGKSSDFMTRGYSLPSTGTR